MPAERLQKIIAAAGIASRRHAEELITQGRVTVNGQVITELGSKADLERDHIKVDGKLLHGVQRHVYLLLNKPKGYVTTVSDPEGRPTVMELVKQAGTRIYPVGRLDYLSEGLLLMTNDGALANHLMSAKSHVPKTYLVKVAGQPKQEDVEKLRHGIKLSAKPGYRSMHAERTAPAQVRLTREGNNPWYEVTLIEGKNRQIRRMFEEIGHHVEKIKRIRYGALTLDVEPGTFRELTPREVAMLRRPGEKQMPKEPERKERRPRQSTLPRQSKELRRSSGPRRGADSRQSAGPRQGTASAQSAGTRPGFVPREGAGPRKAFTPRPGTTPGESAGPRQGFVPRQGSGPRQDRGTQQGLGARERSGPRQGTDYRPRTGSRGSPGPRHGTGPRKDFVPRPSGGPREGADTRESTGPRPSFIPRQSMGPREGDDARERTGRRQSFGPRQSSGPREGGESRQNSRPRRNAGPRQNTGPRQSFGSRKSSGPRHAGKPSHKPR